MDIKDLAKDIKVDEKQVKKVVDEAKKQLQDEKTQKTIDSAVEKVEKKIGVDIPSVKDIAKKL